MSYGCPPGLWLPNPVALSSLSRASLSAVGASQATPASATWPGADRTLYIPFWTSGPAVAYRMFALNGATVGTDTWTLALYSSDSNYLPATNLVEASALSAGANVCQYLNITDTALAAGTLYYMAAALSGVTATVFRTATSPTLFQCYFFSEEANTPATATPTVTNATFLPVIGVSLRASV
jgi:hypothetical protein